MATLFVTRVSGETETVDAPIGRSVMEIIRGAGFDELQAICGGCCSCATCHVSVDPNWFARLPAIGNDEDALLDGSDHRTSTSRLSCQIAFNQDLNGLRVRIV
ncbi:2Fe-2S iron-sulfur cluster-binding protein [Lichenicoccus sp.]|uniref:2Fe-2S iron-sulfur cluster-binding protein n=1 Tax=Lichenicoccus sp. TaxID=2781899 RepID=UPI003D13690A